MSDQVQQQKESSKEPKEAKKEPTSSSGGNRGLSCSEAKSTSSTTSFEDFSSYRNRDVSKESAKVDSATMAAAKEREEKIKQLMKEQEAETARRIAEGIKYGSESSESINTTCRRYQQKITQMKKQSKQCPTAASQLSKQKDQGQKDQEKSSDEDQN